MSLLIILCIFIFPSIATKSLPNDFMLLGLTPTTQLIDGLSCQSYRPYLGANTDYLCSKIPQLHVLLHQANVQARQQCQEHFRDHPWGCQLSPKLNALRRFLRQTSKEASFYTSLASASLTSTLINACIKGQINASECQCSNQRQFCQINPNSTYTLASLITDGLNVSKNLQQKTRFQINQANKELGREIVKQMMQKECRCHGVSGSCELQICRLKARKFSEISEELYSNFYLKARYVQTNAEIATNAKQLLYGRRPIDYCRSNTVFDYSAVSTGRECSSPAACERVCCTRGYQVITELKSIENCHCFFSWNIVNVQCTPCEKRLTRMICL